MPAPAPGASLESNVRDIVQGDVLGDAYRVVKKLGEGGMGTVFLARDVQLDRDVAVKVLARQLCEDAASVARFEREARVTARFDHPNIVPVYAVGQFHQRPFMVMKLLEGTSLAHRLAERKGAWPWAEVRAIVAPLCEGLVYLHQQGLIHRDVKPSNVYVSPSGHVTLLDFGVLKETAKDLTVTGQMLGTMRFMAPEQLTQASTVDARADVYALGVMLYRMLAGRTPFDGDDFVVAQKKMTEDPPSAATLNPALPGPVVDVLLKAVSRDRAARFESADGLISALDRAFAGERVVKRKAPVVPLAAGGVFLVVVSVSVVVLWPKPVIAPAPVPVVVAPAPEPAPVAPDPEPAEPEPEPVAKTPVRRPAKGTAKVSVVSMVDGKSSYAELSVDGVSRGETPAQLELGAGTHRLRLTRAGFRTQDRTVKVIAGKAERLVIELKR
ncbi:MAG: serine/threonine protein kinase [Myxococcaceae bacterium]|nr:serine/threonine protein kinase [Myxococcaceae bacterium]